MVLWVDASLSHEFIMRQSKFFPQDSQMFFHKVRREPVVTGSNGGVSRKDRIERDASSRPIERDAVIFHNPANLLKNGKGAVPLVQMQHTGKYSEVLECPCTTNAEQYLLPYSHASVSAIKP